MTESQQKVLELLPKMEKRFPKYVGSTFGRMRFVAIIGGVMFDIANVDTLFVVAPALIVEACRLIALEQPFDPEYEEGWELVDYSGVFDLYLGGDSEGQMFRYEVKDPFDRARAAMECVLSLEVAADGRS